MSQDKAGTPEAAPAAEQVETPSTDLSQSAAAPESGSEPEKGTVPESGTNVPKEGTAGPKTMLEAIEQGLAGKDNKKADGGDDPARVAGESPEAKKAEPKKADEKKPEKPAEKKAVEPKKDNKTDEEDEDEDFVQPEGLSSRSEGRFKKLVDRTKAAEARFDDLNTRWTAFQEIITENGIQQEQFQTAVGYIGALNRGDFAAARQILEGELKAVALLSGEELKIGDPLDDFPDLKQSVEDLEMPRARALELARFRLANGIQAQEHEQQQVRQSQAKSWEDEKAKAIGEIDTFVKKMEAEDLDWKAKGPIMQANVLKWCEGLPPRQWPAQIRRMYEAIGMGARHAPVNGGGPPARPLRGGGMGAGAKPAPRNMAEAMWGPDVA